MTNQRITDVIADLGLHLIADHLIKRVPSITRTEYTVSAGHDIHCASCALREIIGINVRFTTNPLTRSIHIYDQPPLTAEQEQRLMLWRLEYN